MRVHVVVDIGCLECEAGLNPVEPGSTTRLVGIFPEQERAQRVCDDLAAVQHSDSRAAVVLSGEVEGPEAGKLEEYLSQAHDEARGLRAENRALRRRLGADS